MPSKGEHRHRFDDIPARTDSTVITELKRWWYAASHDSGINAAELHYANSSRNNTHLNKREYTVFYQRLVFAFNQEGDDADDLNIEEAKVALEADWANDSGGDADVDEEDFYNSVFELAETWAVDASDDGDLDNDEIIGYLQTLFPKIFDAPWSDISEFWKFGDASIDPNLPLNERLRLVQLACEDKLGPTCNMVEMDLVNGRIHLKEPINFVGGKADIVPEDLNVVDQLCKVIDTMDELLRKNKCPVIHLRIEGHVAKTKNEEKCWRLSQERAEKLVGVMLAADVPSEILHPVGMGASKPTSATKAENRRVEIHIMHDEDGDGDLDVGENLALSHLQGANRRKSSLEAGIDTTGDGKVDTIGIDTTGDGKLDTIHRDTTGDGNLDTTHLDTVGDGKIDTVHQDTTGDGKIDTVHQDTVGDGKIDTVHQDTVGDGHIDQVTQVIDHDGDTDAVEKDLDGDGVMDVKLRLDKDGNVIETQFLQAAKPKSLRRASAFMIYTQRATEKQANGTWCHFSGVRSIPGIEVAPKAVGVRAMIGTRVRKVKQMRLKTAACLLIQCLLRSNMAQKKIRRKRNLRRMKSTKLCVASATELVRLAPARPVRLRPTSAPRQPHRRLGASRKMLRRGVSRKPGRHLSDFDSANTSLTGPNMKFLPLLPLRGCRPNLKLSLEDMYAIHVDQIARDEGRIFPQRTTSKVHLPEFGSRNFFVT